MSKDRFTVRAAVYLLLFSKDKILLCRRFNTGWSDGMYSLVSGHIEDNESSTMAMCREAKEEAGIVLKPENVRFEHVVHRHSPDADYIDFFFTANVWQGEPHNTEPEKCDDMRWFALDDLPENIVPSIRQVIADYQTDIHFSEYGW